MLRRAQFAHMCQACDECRRPEPVSVVGVALRYQRRLWPSCKTKGNALGPFSWYQSSMRWCQLLILISAVDRQWDYALEFSMYDNPFAAPLNKMEALKNSHANRIAALNTEINWYHSYQPDKVQARVLVLAQALAETDRKLENIDKQIKSLSVAQRAAAAESDFSFNPLHWFSQERTAAKLKLENLNRKLAILTKERVSIATPKTQAGHDFRELHAFHVKKLHEYRNFNVSEAEAEINKRRNELDVLAPELHQLRKRKSNLGEVLDDKLAELEPHIRRLGELEMDMQKAEYFDDQLGAPGAKRAEIHRACEEKFADGKPGRIKSKLRAQIEKEKRVIGKLETIIKQAIKRSQSDIREIIIDGNNMAYDGDEFIGMKALDAIIPLLRDDYKVTINYDPAFNRRVKLSPAALRNRYPGVAADIVPKGTNADYYLLKFAADKPYAYVISNDKFEDYREEQAVREQRILQHAIVNRCISIPFLRIEAEIL